MADPIVRDLMRKCGDDVAEAMWRTVLLAESRSDAAVVATGGAAAALGLAAGAFKALSEEPCSPEEAVCALWEKLRPMAIRAFRQDQPQ